MKKWMFIISAIICLTSCGKLHDQLYHCNIKLSVLEPDVKTTLEDNVTVFNDGDIISFLFQVETHHPDDIIMIKCTCGQLVYENGSWVTYVENFGWPNNGLNKVDSVELTSTGMLADIWARFTYDEKFYGTHIDFKEGDLNIFLNPIDFVSEVEELPLPE